MKKDTAQSGFSIIELIIVLLVLAIMVVFALTPFKNSKTVFKRQNFAREMKVSLERARSDSIKRRATAENSMARVTIESAVSFSLSTDLNQNQVIENSEIKHVNLAGSGIKIVGDNLVFPVTVKFDRRGFITATNGGGTEISPNFTVCENCTTATANSKNSSLISISPTGTVVMLKGGEIPPTFESPTVSTVNNGSQINSLAVVSASPQPTATPPCTTIVIVCL
jgi:prepilin-type N-terminal cleavage/methylation domain-containing protein